MKVLWIVNMVFPNVAKLLNIPTSVSGGWMLDLSSQISKNNEIELAIATIYDGDEFKDISINNIRFFLIPGGSKSLMFYNKKNELWWKKVHNIFSADIVHLHGTEYTHGLAYLNAIPQVKSLLTIQGILTRISEEFYGNLKSIDFIINRRFIENIRMSGTIEKKLLYTRNAKYEREIINRIKHVTGRTFWDYSVIKRINPSIQYHRCNYNLREEFYNSHKWDVNEIQKFSIVTGQSNIPLKGLHVLIKAVALVKDKYPDTKLYVPGGNAIDGRLLSTDSYNKYLNKLIKKLKLEDNIIFVGKQNADGIIKQFLRANVCVVPSAIEGASATLCEAMFLGVPSIAAYRGGMTELLRDRESGFFYDFSEYSVLAERIMEIFDNKNLAMKFSKEIIHDAENRHDRDKNTKDMIDVYKSILNEN